jgi:hypothetical protein
VAQKANQALKPSPEQQKKFRENPIIAHLLRATERFNDNGKPVRAPPSPTSRFCR